METIKIGIELIKAFESRDGLNNMVKRQFDLVKQSGLEEDKWKTEVWEKILTRIRKMQKLIPGTHEHEPKNKEAARMIIIPAASTCLVVCLTSKGDR